MNTALNNLIKKAQGNRTQNTFALNCGINSATLTRILKGENNPKPDLLKKIATHAHNGVSYFDLMAAAGFLDKDNIKEEIFIEVPNNLKDIPIAFSDGLKDLSKEDLDEVSKFVDFLKSKKK